MSLVNNLDSDSNSIPNSTTHYQAADAPTTSSSLLITNDINADILCHPPDASTSCRQPATSTSVPSQTLTLSPAPSLQSRRYLQYSLPGPSPSQSPPPPTQNNSSFKQHHPQHLLNKHYTDNNNLKTISSSMHPILPTHLPICNRSLSNPTRTSFHNPAHPHTKHHVKRPPYLSQSTSLPIIYCINSYNHHIHTHTPTHTHTLTLTHTPTHTHTHTNNDNTNNITETQQDYSNAFDLKRPSFHDSINQPQSSTKSISSNSNTTKPTETIAGQYNTNHCTVKTSPPLEHAFGTMSPLSSPTCSCSISTSDSSPKNYYDYDEDNDGAMDSGEISIHIPATTTTPSEIFDGGSHTLATDPAAHGTDHDHQHARITNSISASSNCCYCCNCCCSTNLQPNTASYHQLFLSEHHHHSLLSPSPTTANTLISSKTLQTATHHNDDETTNTATATNEAVALTAAYDQPPHFDDPSDLGNLDDRRLLNCQAVHHADEHNHPTSCQQHQQQQLNSQLRDHRFVANIYHRHNNHNDNSNNTSNLINDKATTRITATASATCKESSSKKKTSQHRKSSTASSVHSETRTNLILHNVGRTIQRTHNHLKRSRLLHAFYFFALPIYTVLGALVFQALDGEHDDSMKREYDRRCQSARLEHLDQLKLACTHTPDTCFTKMKAYLEHVESCYRTWHAVNRTITHPMSDLTNAIVYAFSVYTTIGYGNMAADTIGCRVATVIYGAFGIPLFFAFIKEEGNLFRLCFICIYKYLQKVRIRIFQWWRRNVRSRTLRSQSSAIRSTSTTQLYSTNQNGSVRRKNNLVAQPSYFNQTVAILVQKAQHFTISSPANHNNNDSTNNNDNNNTKITRNSNANIPFIRKLSAASLFGGTSGGGGGLGLAGGAGTGAGAAAGAGFRAGTGAGAGAGAGAAFRAATGTGAGSLRLSCSPKGPRKSISEQRRVFIAGVAVFIVYLLAISGVFTMMTDWDYFTAFYFLFNSVALIGFGDIFPAEPKIILVNTLFIVMGVILFSMCYFILQEEIRVKAFEASRRARMSICKYSHTIMQHTKNPWSRRNSPAFDSGSSPEPNSAFDKLRKRRQSAPAVSLTVPPPAFFTSPLTTSPPPTSTSRSPSSQHL